MIIGIITRLDLFYHIILIHLLIYFPENGSKILFALIFVILFEQRRDEKQQ